MNYILRKNLLEDPSLVLPHHNLNQLIHHIAISRSTFASLRYEFRSLCACISRLANQDLGRTPHQSENVEKWEEAIFPCWLLAASISHFHLSTLPNILPSLFFFIFFGNIDFPPCPPCLHVSIRRSRYTDLQESDKNSSLPKRDVVVFAVPSSL